MTLPTPVGKLHLLIGGPSGDAVDVGENTADAPAVTAIAALFPILIVILHDFDRYHLVSAMTTGSGT